MRRFCYHECGKRKTVLTGQTTNTLIKIRLIENFRQNCFAKDRTCAGHHTLIRAAHAAEWRRV